MNTILLYILLKRNNQESANTSLVILYHPIKSEVKICMFFSQYRLILKIIFQAVYYYSFENTFEIVSSNTKVP